MTRVHGAKAQGEAGRIPLEAIDAPVAELARRGRNRIGKI
jgi:hypothetical protein